MATAEELLPLAVLKQELRLPADDQSQDEMLERHRLAALQAVQRASGIRLLNASMKFSAMLPADEDAAKQSVVRCVCTNPSAVTMACWVCWRRGPAMIDLAGVTPVFMPEKVDEHGQGKWIISAGQSGWPDYPTQYYPNMLTLGVTVGLVENNIPSQVTQAAVLLARDFYNGMPNRGTAAAVGRLVH